MHSIFMIISFFAVSLQEKNVQRYGVCKTAKLLLPAHLDCDLYKLLVRFLDGCTEISRTEPIFTTGSPSCPPFASFCCVFVVPVFLAAWTQGVAQRGRCCGLGSEQS